MTAFPSTVDQLQAFRNALTPHARAALHMTQMVAAKVHAAIRDHDWTPEQLAEYCSRDLDNTVNPGAVIADHRLTHAAGNPPVHKAGRRHKRVHRHGCNGWIYTTPDDPAAEITFTKCPGCLEDPAP